MRNIKLTMAYKGTAYGGWQIQNNAESIQAMIQQAVFQVTGEKTNLTASGRTDAGVHAAGQVANFFSETEISEKKLPLALNRYLPKDIRILKAEVVPSSFHARYSAHRKTYCYRLYTGTNFSPFYDETAWFLRTPVGQTLDSDAMRLAGQAFLGVHDFKGFMRSGSPVQSTVREIYSLEINDHIPTLDGTRLTEIWITGNGFLYNMVRIIAGTLVEVGLHRIPQETMAAIIASADRNRGGITAPAKGLMLMSVDYGEEK